MEEHFVTNAISLAFYTAIKSHEETWVDWLRVSTIVGEKLPNSHLPWSIQNLGMMDVVLRQIEKEYCPPGKSGQSDVFNLPLHIHLQFSNSWVCDAYELFRLLKDRQLADGDKFRTLERNLRLIRIPLDKHEIAGNKNQVSDKNLTLTQPLVDEETSYRYSPNDPLRAIMTASRFNPKTGSVQWYVFNELLSNDDTFMGWLERRTLSDQILDLWRPEFKDMENDPPINLTTSYYFDESAK